MSLIHYTARPTERSLKVFAAVPGVRHIRGVEWSEIDTGRRRPAGGECYNLLTKEGLAGEGSRATRARVMTPDRSPQATIGAMTHDGALFRRLENFFRARRAEVRAEKLSDSA